MFKIPQLTHTHCYLSLSTASIVIGSCYLGFCVLALLGVVSALFGAESAQTIKNQGTGAIITGTILALIITATSTRFLIGIFKRKAEYMLPFIVLILFLVILCILNLLHSIFEISPIGVVMSLLYGVPHLYILLVIHSYYNVMKRDAGGNPV